MSISSASNQEMPGDGAMEAGLLPATGPTRASYLGSATLFAHPMASAAAMSALGIGVASHAFGVWVGSMTGAALASQRLFAPMVDGMVLTPDDFRDATRTPVLRAKEAAEAMMSGLTDAPDVAKPKPLSRAKPTKKPAVTGIAPVVDPSDVEPPVAEAKAAADDLFAPVAETPVEAAAIETPAAEADVAVEAAAEAVEASAPVAEAVEVLPVAPEAVVEPEMAPEAFVKPVAIDRPETVDDLKAIAGIGPKLEQVLNGFGLWTYGQIAALSAAEIGWLEDAVGFKGRIGRDGWVAQAAGLAKAGEHT